MSHPSEQRLRYVGPVGVAISVGIAAGLCTALFLIGRSAVSPPGTLTGVDLCSSTAFATLGGLASGWLGAMVFNVVAPLLGGVPVRLAPPGPAAGRPERPDDDAAARR